jgi:hypothetical protein
MRLTYPRLIGALALVWTPILQAGALEWSSEVARVCFLVGWLAAGLSLVLGRLVAPAAALLAMLSLLLFLGPGHRLGEALAMLVWASLIIAVTDGRDDERALLVRVFVTVVYVFAALTKLNPSFLSGEQLIALTSDRSQLGAFEDLMRSGWARPFALLTILAEAWLAIGLWIRRTRVPTMVFGAILHLGFILGVHTGTLWDVAFVTVLNGTLVASYLAFASPIPAIGRGPVVEVRTPD